MTKLESGKFYLNGRGDVCGPMEERVPGAWIDQHGAVYQPDGKEWNHNEGSTANLISEHPYAEVRTKGDLRGFKTADLHLNREPRE